MKLKNLNETAIRRAGIMATACLAVIAMFTVGCDDGKAAGAKKPAAGAKADAHDDHDKGKGGDKHAHGKEGGGGEHDEHGHDHGGHSDEVKMTADAVRANGIRIEVAKTHKLSATLLTPARVAYNAEAMAHVGSAITGRVAELKVRIGDTVKKGDVLLTIDSPELGEAQSEYLQRKTAAETAKAAEELSKSAYERAQKLYDDNRGISLTDVQARQREYRAVQGEIATTAAAKAASAQRLQLLGMTPTEIESLDKSGTINATYTIRAPIGGRVIEREATLGELVGPDKERLMMLADLSTVWLLADVPEARLGDVSQGAISTVKVAALSGQEYQGKVGYVSPELDPSTRTARVRIEVPNPEMKLRVGMFGQAEIRVSAGDDEPVVAIPEAAVQTVEGEPAIFVPVDGEPNTFAKRQVAVGSPIGDMVPVMAGLKAGEKYVSVGSFILKADLGKSGAAHEH